jgi:DinB superfamily
MNIKELISEITDCLITTFTNIDLWFDKDAELRSYKPNSGGWTIDQILEHISLTNHYLLILINKGTNKALAHASEVDINEKLENYVFQRDKLTEVGLHKSFDWIRPEHMEPKAEKTSKEVRQQLKDQVSQCLNCLDKLRNGEGVLYKTTMTVNDLGKINVYEYIYFLAQHGQRHLTQIINNATEFDTDVDNRISLG